MKGSVAESVPDTAAVQTRNAAFEAVSALEQICSAPLLKVERSVSDRFLKRSVSSVNTLAEQKLQRNLVLVNDLLKSKGSVANCMTDRACVHVPTQVVTLTQVVTSDNLGLTQVITTVPADPSGNFLPQIRYTH